MGEAGDPIRKPRIGLFEPPNSMDAGWTRWVLERYGFEFVSLTSADIGGTLKDRIDVLVVGDEPRGVLLAVAGPDARRRLPRPPRKISDGFAHSTPSCAEAASWSR